MERSVIDIEDVIVVGGAYRWAHPITRDEETYDLSNKDVRARIRAEHDPDTVVHEDLEEIIVTVTDGEEGEVQWDLTSEMSAHLAAPPFPTRTKPYTLQYRIVQDEYFPDLVRFHVARPG